MLYPNQSAYQAGHSIETIRLKIVSNILSARDDRKLLLLTLLNLLHLTPLIIPCFYHISRLCLVLFSSGCTLPHWNCFCQWLQTVLPQRSIFGPVTFICLLVAVVSHHSFFHHRFSDDNFMLLPISVSYIRSSFFLPSLHFWCPVSDASQETAVAHKMNMILITPKTYSENPNFAVFHPAVWLWNTFVYFCPEPWCHSWSNSLFSVTCILYIYISGTIYIQVILLKTHPDKTAVVDWA